MSEDFNRKSHWENIYQTKNLSEVSWFQPTPETSLSFIKEFKLPLSARIIDIGGGDSLLVDHLLEMGYCDITVLDISPSAIDRAKKRLGEKSIDVKWIISDITEFIPSEKYDFWHDRAAFHFLTNEHDISRYVKVANRAIDKEGRMVIGSFSDKGPLKCSGIEIKQYTASSLTRRFQLFFEKINCIIVDHKTPFNTLQNFVFCSFRKMSD